MDNWHLVTGGQRARRCRNSGSSISIWLVRRCLGYWLLLTKVYHFTNDQAAVLAAYI